MLEIVPLKVWYPGLAAQWTGRKVPRSEREAWIVHHTAGGINSSPLAYARQVADMHFDRWGVPGGYQALIGTDGLVREMCGLDHQGVHSGTHYWNRHGLGLAFQGDFRTKPPSDEMLTAGAKYMSLMSVSQTHHRAVRPEFTHCPGDALIALLPLEDDMPSPKDWTAEDWQTFKEQTAGWRWGGDGYTIPDPVSGNPYHPNTMLRAIRGATNATLNVVRELAQTGRTLSQADIDAIIAEQAESFGLIERD